MKVVSGFVLLATMFFTLVITLTTLAAFEMLREGSFLAKQTVVLAGAKAHLLHELPAVEAIPSEVHLSCDLPWQSPAFTDHQPLDWWQRHGCPVGSAESMYFIREESLLSRSAILQTDQGWVFAKIQRITLVMFTQGGAHAAYQSWMASPSQESVAATVGKHVILAGRQQLECLVG